MKAIVVQANSRKHDEVERWSILTRVFVFGLSSHCMILGAFGDIQYAFYADRGHLLDAPDFRFSHSVRGHFHMPATTIKKKFN